MLTTADLQLIKSLLREELSNGFAASEKKLTRELTTKITTQITSEIRRAKDELRQEIGDYIAEVLMPIIDSKADKSEVDEIKRHINLS